MGIIARLGQKISTGVARLGHKIHAGQVARIAQKVGDVAGAVSKVATAALPFTAEIPVLGEVVAGTAAISKGVQLGAKGVGRVSKVVGGAARLSNKLT